MIPLYLYISSMLSVCAVVGTMALSPRDWRSRVFLLTVSGLVFLAYMYWRLTTTVLWGDSTFHGLYTQLMALIEILWVMDVLHGLHFHAYPNRTLAKKLTPAIRRSSVNVVIPTYNEPVEILERTLMCAKSLVWSGPVDVYVLDDGKRDWLPEVCEKWGCHYLSRPDNRDAKAGNINHALPFLQGDFTLIFDADFLAHPLAIEKLMVPMVDETVAVVQSPQDFYNGDPVQEAMGIAKVSPTDQHYFFNTILHARSNAGAAFFCGTSGLIRNKALKLIDGFPTESITEDIFLSIRLKAAGWKSISIQEPVATGLSPQNLQDLITQRSRWGEGALQMNRFMWTQRKTAKAGWMARLQFFPFYWMISYPIRVLSMVIPQLYFLLGWTPMHNSSLEGLLIAQGSLVVSLLVLNSWLAGKNYQPVVTTIWQDLLSLRLSTKFLMLALGIKGNSPFLVTPKGQQKIQGSTTNVFGWILVLMLMATLVAIGIACQAQDGGQLNMVSLFWCVVNLFRLTLLLTVVRRAQHQSEAWVGLDASQLPEVRVINREGMNIPVNGTINERFISGVINEKQFGMMKDPCIVQIHDSHGVRNIASLGADGALSFLSANNQKIWTSLLVRVWLDATKTRSSFEHSSRKAIAESIKSIFRQTEKKPV